MLCEPSQMFRALCHGDRRCNFDWYTAATFASIGALLKVNDAVASLLIIIIIPSWWCMIVLMEICHTYETFMVAILICDTIRVFLNQLSTVIGAMKFNHSFWSLSWSLSLVFSRREGMFVCLMILDCSVRHTGWHFIDVFDAVVARTRLKMTVEVSSQ